MSRKTEYNILIDGQPIFVREVLPAKETAKDYLLFVHGNTFPSIPDFDLEVEGRSYVAYLSQNNICCCIFDSRGYGRSYKPKPEDKNGLYERATDLKAVYEHLVRVRGANTVSLFGLSTGCNVIAEFLERLPKTDHHIGKIIFSGPCYLFNDKAMAVNKQLFLLRVLRKLTGQGGNLYFSFKKKQLEKRLLNGEEDFIDKAACTAFIAHALEPTRFGDERLRSPVLGFPNRNTRYRPWQRLFKVQNLTFPMLILRGERDHYFCEKSARHLIEDVPSRYAKLITLPATNHDMHLYQNPAAVFQEVSRFMKE